MQRNTINNIQPSDTDTDTQLLERVLAKSQRNERRTRKAIHKQRRLSWEVVDTASDEYDWEHVA